MTLSCIDSEGFTLEYDYLAPLEVMTVYSKPYPRNFSAYSYDELTYSIREDFSVFRTVCFGTYKGTERGSCGKIYYWGLQQAPNFPNLRYELIKYDDGWSNRPIWRINYFNDSEINTHISESNFTIEPISKELYDAYTSGVSYSYSTLGNGEIYVFEGQCDSNNYGSEYYASEASVTHQIDAYRKNWIVDVVADGNLLASVSTFSYSDPTNRNIPHPDTVTFRGQTEVRRKTRSFSKTRGTQGVEVVTHPSAPHQKLVYLVNLSSQGVEQSRTVVFSFSLGVGMGTPYYSLNCAPSSVCPGDTCEVPCGDTICCYGSDGIALASFPRT